MSAKHHESPAAAFIGDYLAANPLYGWDELTAVAATDESIIDIEERKLAIVEADGVGRPSAQVRWGAWGGPSALAAHRRCGLNEDRR